MLKQTFLKELLLIENKLKGDFKMNKFTINPMQNTDWNNFIDDIYSNGFEIVDDGQYTCKIKTFSKPLMTDLKAARNLL